MTLSSAVYGQNGGPCSKQEEFTKLDFWVGEWKVNSPDGTLAGHSKISKILDNCSILEEWTGAGASRGKSLNFYNPQKKHWEQIWIDNFANPLHFKGITKPDSMIYSGTSISQDGATIYNKMILSKETEKNVRQLWSQSKDNGLTWTIVFDGQYLKTN